MFSSKADADAGTNTAALQGLIVGIISLVFNPFALIGVGAIIWSVVGIRRSNAFQVRGGPAVGRTLSVWGLVLGVVASAAFLVFHVPLALIFFV